METIERKNWNQKFTDIQRNYLDEAGAYLIIELLLSKLGDDKEYLEGLLKAHEEKADKDHKDLEARVTKPLILGNDNANTNIIYNGTEQKRIIAKFVQEGSEMHFKVGFGDVENPNWADFGSFDTSAFTKDAFLKNVEIKYFPNDEYVLEDALEGDETSEYPGLVFTFIVEGNDGAEVPETVVVPIADFFNNKASKIVISAVEGKDEDGNIIFTWEEGSNIQDVLADVAGKLVDLIVHKEEHHDAIVEIQKELDRFKPISHIKILKMFNNEFDVNKYISEGLTGQENFTLDMDFESPEVLGITGKTGEGAEDIKIISLGSSVLSTDPNAENNKYGDTLSVNGGNIAFIGGTIKGSTKTDEAGTIIVKEGSNVIIDGTTVTGVNPVYVWANGPANVLIESGEFLSDGCQAIYVEKNAGGVVEITGGYFECKDENPAYIDPEGNHRFLINLKDGLRKPTTEKEPIEFVTVTGGTFVNFNPANNYSEGEHTNYVAEGYHVEMKLKGGKRLYSVVKD